MNADASNAPKHPSRHPRVAIDLGCETLGNALQPTSPSMSLIEMQQEQSKDAALFDVIRPRCDSPSARHVEERHLGRWTEECFCFFLGGGEGEEGRWGAPERPPPPPPLNVSAWAFRCYFRARPYPIFLCASMCFCECG